MSIEQIFLIIILLNVVSSIITRQRRKKKLEREQAERARQPVQPADDEENAYDLLAVEEEEHSVYQDPDAREERLGNRTYRRAPRLEEPERDRRRVEQGDSHWAGHYDPADRRHDPEQRLREAQRRLDEESRRRPLSREERERQGQLQALLSRLPDPAKARQVGKDVLNELAKELGLHIPGRGEPPLKEAPPRPRPPQSGRAEGLESRDVIREKTLLEEKLGPEADTYGARATWEKAQREKGAWEKKQWTRLGGAGDEGPRKRRQPDAAIPDAVREKQARVRGTVDMLRHRRSLEEAYILKTVLDPPVARLPRSRSMMPRKAQEGEDRG